MLPSSSFLSPGSAPAVDVPPPQGFRPLKPPLNVVSFSISGEFERLRGNTAAREAGLRYEQHVHLHLREQLGANYVAVELHVGDQAGVRLLKPDGLAFFPSHCVVFEVKSQHMPEAWWQLRKLYQPVLQFKLGTKRPVYVVEVCRSYDPAMPFPEPVELIDSILDYARKPRPVFGVYQWKP